MKSITIKHFILTGLFSLIISCQSFKTAVYDQYSYQQTIALKVASEHVMSQATASFVLHSETVDDLLLDLKTLLEYEKNREHNEISYAMLKLLANADKNLLAGFFKRWEEEQQLSEAFTVEAKAQIAEAFDLIIRYELDKNKTNETNMLSFLNRN